MDDGKPDIKEHRINGRIHYGYCYEKTYHEARDKVNQARYALMNDQLLPVRGKRNRFADYCNEWLYLKRSSVKPSTFVNIQRSWKNISSPDLGQYFSGGCFRNTCKNNSATGLSMKEDCHQNSAGYPSVLHSIPELYRAESTGKTGGYRIPGRIEKKCVC